MEENNFNALLTFDKNLQHQQIFKNTQLPFCFTATINTYKELTKLSESVQSYLMMKTLPAGPLIIRPDKSLL